MILDVKFHRKSLLAFICAGVLAPFPAFSSEGPCEPGADQSDLLVLGACSGDEAVLETLVNPQAKTIGLLLQRAIDNGLIYGGVALTGNSRGILSVSARGKLNESKGAPRLGEETIFDLASLTKVVATAPAVMKLLEDGEISLADPLTRWFPEFKGSRHAKITIFDLLTHTSGLEDVQLHQGQAIDSLVHKAVVEKCRVTPGSRFNYADINFMLLGELVRRVSGKTLDVFCQEQLYDPLDMKQTMFLPPKELQGVIAATAGFGSGVVQDMNARRLGRVAGHAGLFSSTRDLSRYARVMLGGGELDGKRIFSESVIAQMTSPHVIGNGTIKRGLGWDIDSPFSAPKSILFSNGSFGHTGYSGSSMWIDPQSDLFVILLTVRRSYRHVAYFNQLRRDISTIAAAEFGRLEEVSEQTAQGAVARVTQRLSGRQMLLASLHDTKPKAKHQQSRRIRRQGKIAHPPLGIKVKNQGKPHKKRRRPVLSALDDFGFQTAFFPSRRT